MKIRTVLLLPLNYTHLQAGMIQGFQQVFGAENVDVFDFMCAADRLIGAATRTPDQVRAVFIERVAETKPDLVFMQLQDTGVITAEAIIAARAASPDTVFVHWTGDYRPEVSKYLGSICCVTDVTFASSVGQLPAFVAMGAPEAVYLQIGVDWNQDVLGLPAWEPPFEVPEIVFCGNHYAGGPWPAGTVQRLTDIRALKAAGFNVGVVGTGWPSDIPVVGECHVKHQHHVYTRARVVLSISHENTVDRYFSDRLLIGMASGTPTIARWFPGIEAEFAFNNDPSDGPVVTDDPLLMLLPYYKTETDLVDLVAEFVANEDLRRNAGADQCNFIRATASWFSRIVETVLPVIDG
jgi:hypothetical protein